VGNQWELEILFKEGEFNGLIFGGSRDIALGIAATLPEIQVKQSTIIYRKRHLKKQRESRSVEDKLP
jgi:hypothetical protein